MQFGHARDLVIFIAGGLVVWTVLSLQGAGSAAACGVAAETPIAQRTLRSVDVGPPEPTTSARTTRPAAEAEPDASSYDAFSRAFAEPPPMDGPCEAATVWPCLPVQALPAGASVTLRTASTREPVKVFVKPSWYRRHASAQQPVIYGLGVADDISFEAGMAQYGSVFAFDCTSPRFVESKAKAHNVTFRRWCIGREGPLSAHYVAAARLSSTNFTFKSLMAVKKELGHDVIDVLKFDIEGYEWMLLETEILSAAGRDALPMQLMFELHIAGSSPKHVPERLVGSKGRAAVLDLFRRLFALGYRLVGKSVNHHERPPHACEMTLLLIGRQA